MQSIDILLNLIPEDLRKSVQETNIDEVLNKFMFDKITDTDLVYVLSDIANIYNTIEAHAMAGSVFHFHFNWLDKAYEFAFYHYWRALEIDGFKNQKSMNEVMEVFQEPDFDVIPLEYQEFLRSKIV